MQIPNRARNEINRILSHYCKDTFCFAEAAQIALENLYQLGVIDGLKEGTKIVGQEAKCKTS